MTGQVPGDAGGPMRLLLDARAPGSRRDVTDVPALDDAALAEVYAYPPETGPGRPWLRANMVSTLDGSATGADGRTGSINNPADKQVFSLLRALADVIVVGAGTARAEGYRPPRTVTGERARLREGRPPAPTLVVVSRSANLPLLLADTAQAENAGQDAAGAVLLATCAAADPDAVAAARRSLGEDHVLVLGSDEVDLRALVDELARRGLVRMLTEGGPHLLRDLTAAGLLDELCLTLVPLLVAGEHRGMLAGDGVDAALPLRTLVEADGTLMGRWFA